MTNSNELLVKSSKLTSISKYFEDNSHKNILNKKTEKKLFYKKILITIILLFFVKSITKADGTKQVMPDPNNGVAMYITDDGRYGPNFNSSASQRLQFRILDHTTENLYFGVNPRIRRTPPALVNAIYYRIKNSAGTVVAGPALFSTTSGQPGFIGTYNQAVAGPNIGGAVPAGYNPLTFNPTADGDYYIEIYKSTDGGNSVTTADADIVLPYFDFTVSDASNNRSEGRIFSQKWGFITYNPTNFTPSIEYDFKGKFFGYTDDKIVVTVEFQEGFRPFGYLLAMNKFGVVDDDNNPANVWATTRKSISYNGSTGNSIPQLLNGYPVFITEPDQAAFPITTTPPPISVGQIFGCPGNYLIPVVTEEAGDVEITLDLNGIVGYQENSKDIIVQAFNQPKGNIVIPWDGIDGQGNPVLGNTTSSAKITSLRGRTSVPMIDAELNPNGLIINSVKPILQNRKMYWDDSSVVVTPNNNTVGGANQSNPADGKLGPTHKWNGDNPPTNNTPNTPAPAGTKGSSTTSTTDDFGNERVLNTWFYGEEVTSPNFSTTVPDCDIDNDGISDNADLDDDNDGILDTVELGSFDPNGDHDGDTIPDYIDPQFPGFTDTNSDGVDDRFDFDLDGIMNHWDLDSDNDGIPDTIEAQSTTSYTAPSSSINGNGVPINFASGITPVNTDGDANADFLDIDSDGDSLTDTAEAGITLTNLDDDKDGLDNAIDTTNGPDDKDGTINNPSNLPDEDNDVNTAEGDVDYRDNTDSDNDNDGVPDSLDLDDDNDGILDTNEGFVENCLVYNGIIISQTGVTNSTNIQGIPDNNFGQIYTNGNVFTIDFGKVYPAGTRYQFHWRRRNNVTSGTAIMVLSESSDNVSFTTHSNPPQSSQNTIFETDEVIAETAFRYVRVTKTSPPSIVDFEIDAIGVNPSECSLDSDNDGIPNYKDTDSDNDGCSDAQEGAGIIQESQLTILGGGSNGGSSKNLGTISDAEGNPIVNGSGYEQNTTVSVTDSSKKEGCLVDLNLVKTVNKSVVKIGDSVIFTIKLTNNGFASATGVEVLDLLPSGLTYNQAASTIPINTTYNSTTGIWDLSLLTITKNQTIELKLAATVNTINIKINKAEIFKSDQLDVDSIPNSNN